MFVFALAALGVVILPTTWAAGNMENCNDKGTAPGFSCESAAEPHLPKHGRVLLQKPLAQKKLSMAAESAPTAPCPYNWGGDSKSKYGNKHAGMWIPPETITVYYDGYLYRTLTGIPWNATEVADHPEVCEDCHQIPGGYWFAPFSTAIWENVVKNIPWGGTQGMIFWVPDRDLETETIPKDVWDGEPPQIPAGAYDYLPAGVWCANCAANPLFNEDPQNVYGWKEARIARCRNRHNSFASAMCSLEILVRRECGTPRPTPLPTPRPTPLPTPLPTKPCYSFTRSYSNILGYAGIDVHGKSEEAQRNTCIVYNNNRCKSPTSHFQSLGDWENQGAAAAILTLKANGYSDQQLQQRTKDDQRNDLINLVHRCTGESIQEHLQGLKTLELAEKMNEERCC